MPQTPSDVPSPRGSRCCWKGSAWLHCRGALWIEDGRFADSRGAAAELATLRYEPVSSLCCAVSAQLIPLLLDDSREQRNVVGSNHSAFAMSRQGEPCCDDREGQAAGVEAGAELKHPSASSGHCSQATSLLLSPVTLRKGRKLQTCLEG